MVKEKKLLMGIENTLHVASDLVSEFASRASQDS